MTRNDRWVGGYITRHYSRMKSVQTLQIELKFRTYLDNVPVRPKQIEENTETFREARERLGGVFEEALGGIMQID